MRPTARRLRIAGLAAALLLTGSVASAKQPFFPDELRAACSAKRLDWLNPGIIIDGVDAFKEGLPPALQHRLEALAKPALDRCEAGAGCVNAAYIGAARQLGRVGNLVTAVCALPYRCTAPFTCDAN